MLGARLVAGKVVGGNMWLLSERVQGVEVGVGSERRPLIAASSCALEDSGLERFFETCLGRRKADDGG